jgi:N,N-dimethylformamidase
LAKRTTTGESCMVYYDTPSGGWVFSVGSITFGGSLVKDEQLQTIVRNALDECLQ